jgi:hypothetical protein
MSRGRGMSQKNLDLIEHCRSILAEIQPTTVRGVAYQLFTRGLIENMGRKCVANVYVGTNDPIAKYHELGTRTIPPRSFLGEAAMRQEHKIHEMMERTIAATFDRGGPHYRELRELFHVLHMAYEEGKKLADELLDEDEQ